jgi:hypothetical protein
VKFIQLVFILGYAITVFASDSPDTREITDPKSTCRARLRALSRFPWTIFSILAP